MPKRNLLSTGATRGNQLVVLVDRKKGVAIVVRNALGYRRSSKLDECLAGAPARTVAGTAGVARPHRERRLTDAMPCE